MSAAICCELNSWGYHVQTRTTTLSVTFRHGFHLPGYGEEVPAGTYDVLCEDEHLEGLTFDAFRRLSTYLRIAGAGMQAGRTEWWPVSQRDLEAALLADQGDVGAQASDPMPDKPD